MAKPKMSKSSAYKMKSKCYGGQGDSTKVGNMLHGLIDPRRYVEYKDFMQMPDDKTAFANLSPKAFQVEVYYEDDKKLDN
jgi:hypothetical protein